MKELTKMFIYISMFILFTGCSGMVTDLKTMSKLQDTISKKYETRAISVNITNGKYLTVSMINSKYNDSSAICKQMIAAEIGKIVLATIGKEKTIEFGQLAFVKKRNFIIFNSTNSIAFDMKLDSLSQSDLILPINEIK